MRLYVENKNTNEKIHLRLVAKTKKELSTSLGARTFTVNGSAYDVSEVKAELGTDSATVAALVGGLIGVIGGAPGVVIGSTLGALLGSGQADQEKKEVELFNGSSI